MFDRQTQLSLIHGIFSDPDDDAARLVYADWLEEQGDSLGELVRIQTEMRCHWLPRGRRAELVRRERELLNGFGFDQRGRTIQEIHGDEATPLPGGWNFAIFDGVALLDINWPFTSQTLPPPEWVERFGWFVIRIKQFNLAESVYELPEAAMRDLLASPLMERCIGLDLCDMRECDEAINRLARSPVAARLLRLILDGSNLDPDVLAVLAQSSHFTGLLDFRVSYIYLDNEEVRTFAKSRSMPALRRLRMSAMNAPAKHFRGLAGTSRFPELRWLDLSRNGLSASSVRSLAETCPSNLVALNLHNNRDLNDEAAVALIRSPHFQQLQQLDLSQTAVGTPTVEALSETDRFFRCGELYLFSCATNDESLAGLARSPHSALLRVIHSGWNRYTDAGAKALASSPYLKNLVKLDLSNCRIGPDGAEALTDPEVFPHLEELKLWNNLIGDRGAMALARWCREHGQPDLLLSNVGLTTAGLMELVRSGCLAGVVRLWLTGNQIEDAGLAVLAQCSDLGELRQLDIRSMSVTDAGIAELISSLWLSPGLELWTHIPSNPENATRTALAARFARVYPLP